MPRPAAMRLLMVLAALLGLAGGVGLYTFAYARGASYLTNDPAACANCHVMHEQYAAWTASSHHGAAVCNDCHTPPGLVAKYVTKAENGFWHSFAFTTGRFPEPIRITERNRDVTERACRGCHAAVVEAIDGSPRDVVAPGEDPRRHGAPGTSGRLPCTQCHRDVGHLH